MNVFHLAVREIRYRKLGFALGALSIAVATSCLVAELLLLHKHDVRTEQIIAAKEAQTRDALAAQSEQLRQKMASLQDDYRKITKNLGFNVLILPKDQNLSDLYADDYATKFMPESYVETLAKSRLVTIQHLLPSLQLKTKWPERQRTVIVIGVRGEVPIIHADSKKPILEPVAAGSMVLGHELHRSLDLKVGDGVKFMGRDFKVAKLHPERGNKDDITLWIPLREAQELFDRQSQINGILALECVCAADSLAKIRAEIGRILPETQVIEYASQALVRAEARQRAASEAVQSLARSAADAKDSIEREKQGRARLRQAREGFAAILVPLVIAGAALWIGLLSLANVRQRRPEIGILRAIGLKSRQILAIILSRAVLIGLTGAVTGFAAGVLIGAWWREGDAAIPIAPGITWKLLGITLAAAPLLAAMASWIPALLAAQQDPATILSEE